MAHLINSSTLRLWAEVINGSVSASPLRVEAQRHLPPHPQQWLSTGRGTDHLGNFLCLLSATQAAVSHIFRGQECARAQKTRGQQLAQM